MDLSMIEPYYKDENCTIYHGDCREVLPSLGKFDLLLTDPPYGIGHLWNKKRLRFESCRGRLWDGSHKWDLEVKQEEIDAARAMSDKAIIWGGNYYQLPPSRGYLVWDKMQSDFSLADSELAWCSWPATPKTHRLARTAIIHEGKKHPTQKPTSLIRWCIGIAGKEVKTILDPFMGSGTTLVAAKLEGRHAVGIELDERYCEMAVNRLAQGVLF